MSLIKCPECSKEVSDQTDKCPHCGYPLSKPVVDPTNAGGKKSSTTLKIVAVILGIIALLVLFSAFGDLSKIF